MCPDIIVPNYVMRFSILELRAICIAVLHDLVALTFDTLTYKLYR